MKIRAILENISPQQRGVGQLPADFDPPNTSPQLSGPYPGRNATRGYLVGESSNQELYGLRVGDTVMVQLDGGPAQGDIIDIYPDTQEVELLLRGPDAGRTITVDVRDTQALDEQSVQEGHADQQRKIFKKNGEPVGEVGIDRESSPGVGQYYMKHYASNTDNSGYDSFEDALAELRHAIKQGVSEAIDIGQEWMTDTELDQYVPDQLQQQWRELVGYDAEGNVSALWANITGGYEPDANDPEDRANMVKVANKWFAMKRIPNVRFFDVRDVGDELEWLVQIGAQGVAEGSLNEYRDRLLQYVKSLLPTWPEYVLKDWLVPNKGDFSNLPSDALKNSVMEKLNLAGLTANTKWQLVPNMQFTMDMFDPMTKQRLTGRAGGHSDMGLNVPRDKERHATQAALAQQQGGVRKEPVILIKTAKGYELLEGWHRTIQHFAKYPNGYTGPAYIAVAQGQQGVAEGSLKEFRDDDDDGGGGGDDKDKGFSGRGSWKLDTRHYDKAIYFYSLFDQDYFDDERWIKDPKTGKVVAWEGWRRDQGDTDALGRSNPGKLRKMGGFRWDDVNDTMEDDAPGTGWYYSWSPDWKDIYRQGRDPKEGVAEGGYNPLDDERREQSRMDAERREFKRDELAAELGGEEQRAQQIMRGTWYVIIDGRVWQRGGQPVTLAGRDAARRAGQTIKNRTPERTVTITTKLPTTENATRDRVAQMRAQTQDRLQTMRANAQAGRDRLRGGTQAPATRKTNAAGVTQHDWMAQARKQGARLIQSKMIDGPVIAIYPDGRRDAWQPVGESVSESVKQHHFIYENETHERIKKELEDWKARMAQYMGHEWEARKAQYVQQAMDRDEKRREYEREKKEKEAQAHQHSTPGQEEFIAPHGDARNEVAMFQAGTKPAAVVNAPDVGLWSSLINSGRYVIQQLRGEDGQPSGYVIGQPGEEERVEKIHALVQNASDRGFRGDFSAYQNSNYHRWLGRLLGYPASKIEQFIANYFRDTPDRAQARYDEDADFHRGRQPGVRYAIRDAQGRVLSTHDDIDSARDELQGIEDRAGYRIVQTRQPAGSWDITEGPLDIDLIKRAQGGMAGTNQDPDSERFRDQPYGYRDRAQNKFDPMAKLDKGSVNSIERALGIKWPKHRAWQGTVKVDESREQRYARVFREAVASGMALEDVVDQVRGELGDYLQIVARAMKKRPEAMKPRQRPEDRLGPPLRTIHTDDGREIHIHGNEDDGFRISIGGRTMRESFAQLSEAEIATEIYCARRRQRDYQQER